MNCPICNKPLNDYSKNSSVKICLYCNCYRQEMPNPRQEVPSQSFFDTLRSKFNPRGILNIGPDFITLDSIEHKNKCDLITIVNTLGKEPTVVLKKAVECLSNSGTLFIQVPDIDTKGLNLSEHAVVYSSQSLYILADKIDCDIFKVENVEGSGCCNYHLRRKRNHPTLSVCMIVRNEEKVITDCLESIKTIADEIIVVDTGSTDRTKDIVSKYTNKIYDFKWIDDFSAARNFSLSKATSDWLMYLDADDVLQNPDNIIPLLKDKHDVHSFTIAYNNDVFKSFRLFRNFLGFKFSGRVHEYVTLGIYQAVESGMTIRHKSGRHFNEDRSERNYRILSKELESEPQNPRILFYTANALRELSRYDEAVTMYNKYLSVSTWPDEKVLAQRYIGDIYYSQKKYTEAIEEYKKAREIDNRWAEPAYFIAECYYSLQNYTACIDWLLNVTHYKKPVSPLWITTSIYNDLPYRLLSLCYEKVGNLEHALDSCKTAAEKSPDDQILKDRCVFLERKLQGLPLVIECYRQGALGDCLMTTAAVRGLRQKYPGYSIRYVTHPNSMKILQGCKCIDELVSEPGKDAAMKIYFSYPDKDSPVKDEGYPNKPLLRHLIKIFNECAGIPENEQNMECSLTSEENRVGEALRAQYKKYVTVHIKSGWSFYKDWYNDRWEIVTEELFKMGYVTIQVGHTTDPVLSNAVDFRNNDLKKTIAAMRYADIHMGVDSVTNHISAAIETPSIILFGSTSPTGSGYSQNTNLYKSLPCQPCYREYEWSKDSKGTCPYEKKCMNLITTEEVLQSAKKLLEE